MHSGKATASSIVELVGGMCDGVIQIWNEFELGPREVHNVNQAIQEECMGRAGLSQMLPALVGDNGIYTYFVPHVQYSCTASCFPGA